MKKVTYTERRSGQERRQRQRRSLWRMAREFWKPSTWRRHHARRAPYIRRDTYTIYVPDRV